MTIARIKPPIRCPHQKKCLEPGALVFQTDLAYESEIPVTFLRQRRERLATSRKNIMQAK